MNSVHFPKLDEYAIEPVLIKEPSSYGYFGTPSSGNNSSSQAGERHEKIDHFSKSRRSAYFKRTSNLKDSNEIVSGIVYQEKTSKVKENVDLDDSNKIVRRQTAVERAEDNRSVDVNVPFLPSLSPGRTSLVSDNFLGNGHLRYGSSKRHGIRDSDEQSAKKSSHKVFQKQTATNLHQANILSDRGQLESPQYHTSSDYEFYADDEEYFPSTSDALKKAYKLRKGTEARIQSRFIDGSLWDYEVPSVGKERGDRGSLQMPSIYTNTNLTTHNVLRDVVQSGERSFSLHKIDDETDDTGAKRRFRSKLQNGYNFIGPRQSLWRVPLRKIMQRKDVSRCLDYDL